MTSYGNIFQKNSAFIVHVFVDGVRDFRCFFCIKGCLLSNHDTLKCFPRYAFVQFLLEIEEQCRIANNLKKKNF